MTVIPFKPRKKQENNHPKDTLLATYYTLEDQIEQLDAQIQTKEEKLQALSHWKNSETFQQYQKEINMLKHERVLLEKTQQVVMKELMKEESE